jgi:serine/threonine protein phosphatase PrpC
MTLKDQTQLFLDAAFQTRRGPTRRINEDAAVCLPGDGIFVVADGLGGASGGEIASGLAVENVSRSLQEESPPVISPSDILSPEQLSVFSEMELAEEGSSIFQAEDLDRHAADDHHLKMALLVAHARIMKEAAASPDLKGMGAAAVVAWLKGDTLRVAHVGDCRAYLTMNDGFVRLTEDHSLVNALERKGALTEQEAMRHPLRNHLTQVLGGDMLPVPEVTVRRARPGNRILLCSDGVWSALGEREMGRILKGKGTPFEISEALVKSASPMEYTDDATALVVIFRDANSKE